MQLNRSTYCVVKILELYEHGNGKVRKMKINTNLTKLKMKINTNLSSLNLMTQNFLCLTRNAEYSGCCHKLILQSHGEITPLKTHPDRTPHPSKHTLKSPIAQTPVDITTPINPHTRR